MLQASLQTTATWADFGIEAVKILGPATITAVVTWLALRSQKQLKKIDTEAQAKLKARELMFNSYQSHIDRHQKEVTDIGATLGKLGVALQVENDPNERNQLLASLMGTLGGLVFPVRLIISDMEEELKTAGLVNKYRTQLDALREVAAMDVMHVPLAEAATKYETVMAALAYASLIQNALVEHKRMQLFREYLPSTKISS